MDYKDVLRASCLAGMLLVDSALCSESLEEITVTAQLRAQSLDSVPIPISVFAAPALKNSGARDIRDLARQAPALEVQTNTGPDQVAYRLRRVGNLSNIPTFEPAVGLYLDGAFRSRALFGAADFLDLERVEILRGPQTTLYGKNATAGVIGIYTQKPQASFHTTAEYSLGTIDGPKNAPAQEWKIGVTGPVADNLRASLNAAQSDHGYTAANGLAGGGPAMNEQHRRTIGTQLYWENGNDDLRLILRRAQENEDGHDGDIYYDPQGWVATFILPTLQNARISTPCTSNDPHDRIFCARTPLHSDLNADEATLIGNHQFANGWTITSISSWDRFRFEGRWDDAAQLAAPLLRFHDTQQEESLQQQLRVMSPSDAQVEWIAGAFYYSNRFRFGDNGNRPEFLYDTQSDNPAVIAINNALLGTAIPLATPGQEGRFSSQQDTESKNIFAQATWNISETFALTSGLRWVDETKTAAINNTLNDPSPSIISLLLAPPSVNGTLKRKTEATSWSVTPQYRWLPNTLVFATMVQGYKPGGFNVGFGNLPLNKREFDNEDVTHYEIGVKSLHASNRIRLSANAFHTEYKNFQTAAFIGGQFTVGNAERVDLNGFELEGSANVSSNFTIDAAISYADLAYGKNTHGQCQPFQIPNSPTDARACDLSGKNPINAPLWKTHLGAQLSQSALTVKFYERIDWACTSHYNTSFSADPRLVQPAYSWINLRAGAIWDHFEITAWVKNALDETVADAEAVQNLYAGPGDGSVQSYLQDARSYGLTLRSQF